MKTLRRWYVELLFVFGLVDLAAIIKEDRNGYRRAGH